MVNLAGHLGGALLLLGVGVLWLVYLVPGWVDRYRTRTARRNLARMQDALSVLTAHQTVPEPLEAEVSARSAMRLSRSARRVQRARERKEQADMRAQEREHVSELRRQERAARRRARAATGAGTRRGRLVCTTLTAAGIVAAVVGLVWITSQPAIWPLLVGGCALAFAGGALLVRVNSVARRAPAPLPSRRPEHVPVVHVEVGEEPAAPQPDRGWVPRELPEPLAQLTHERALNAARAEAGLPAVRAQLDALTAESRDAQERLDRASDASVGALREALAQTDRIERAAHPTPSVQLAGANGTDGTVETGGLAPQDLDEILRRRRVG